MSKAIRWQLHFHEAKPDSKNPKHYRVDIYDEQDGTWSGITQLTAGDQPFVTDEDASDDFFCPVRTQTGTLQICTLKPDGQYITLDELLPANNIARPVKVWQLLGGGAADILEWQGFLSCEAYSQDYVGIPENISFPVISVLEAMKSMPLSSYWFDQISGETVSNFVLDMFNQIEEDTGMQLTAVFSQASNDILSKYIFASQYFTYEAHESTGNINYVHSSTSLHDIMSDICQFMGWCLREVGSTFYFTRLGSDELGMTSADMSSLQWMGTGHQRTIMQGAKSVSVEAAVNKFDTYFEMPQCPTTGLIQKNAYTANSAYWYYDKCPQTTVGKFVSNNINNAFLARFYGIRTDSAQVWNTVYTDIGFNNSIYLVGHKFTDSSYTDLCSIKTEMDFSVICGVYGTLEDVGHFVIKITDKAAAEAEVDGYIRCGLKFAGKYYSKEGAVALWLDNFASFKIDMSRGSGEIQIPLPKLRDLYTFAKSPIEVFLFNDFDNTKTSAIISEVSVEYVPSFRKNTDEASSNRYWQNLGGYRDDINISLNLASSFNNRNALSLIYEVHRYWYVQEYVDYLQPITTILYNLAGGTTEARRPEVDLLNRLASYYGAARQRLELEVAHPTDAPLPMLRLNGINDGKVYLPLSESRDWRTDVCKLTCFELPEQPSESE